VNDIRAKAATSSRHNTAALPVCPMEEPENLTARQRASSPRLPGQRPPLPCVPAQRAATPRVPSRGGEAKRLLGHWLGWAARCRIPRLSNWAARFADTSLPSTPRSITASLTASSNRPIQDPTPHSHRIRLPLTRSAHCLGSSRPRRLLPPLPGRVSEPRSARRAQKKLHDRRIAAQSARFGHPCLVAEWNRDPKPFVCTRQPSRSRAARRLLRSHQGGAPA